MDVAPASAPSKGILNALADDLNTPLVISELHKLATENKLPLFLASARFVGLLGEDFDNSYLKKTLNSESLQLIERAIAKRLEAKQSKDFELADYIRKQIKAAGITLKDTSNGTEWEIDKENSLSKLKDLI